MLGTIADREHRKWIEKAVPLSHNPYSKESLEKRLSRASVDSGTSTMQSRLEKYISYIFPNVKIIFFPSSVLNDNMVDNQNGSSKTANSRDLYVVASSPELPRGGRIDCGPKLANLRRYWRDYYVVDNNKTLPNSSTMASVDNKVIINKAKIELVKRLPFYTLSKASYRVKQYNTESLMVNTVLRTFLSILHHVYNGSNTSFLVASFTFCYPFSTFFSTPFLVKSCMNFCLLY